ncbi:MAG: hydantoinase/oxoprolinase family protein [Syntrophobacterales bacterium]|nr:MAG: hydantoinase/oxoprolinase family protein [Syntrophobacterales bacterium]
MESLSLAIDIGGTFTDLVVFDEKTKKINLIKVPTIPEKPSIGVINGVDRAAIDLSKVSLFIHGTTLPVNAVLERRGAKTGIITTRGFRDIFEIRRTNLPEKDMYNLLYEAPPILVPRYLRLEIAERINAQGEVIEKMVEHEVKEVVEKLVREGVQSIAVCLLHSYANPTHEIEIRDIIGKYHPELSVSLSHIMCREYREFERTSTAVINAYIQPIVEKYLEGLERDFQDRAFDGRFLVCRSGGGAMGIKVAREAPVNAVLSGPAGGLMGASHLSRRIDHMNLLTMDMGGTSFDTSLIANGEPETKSETELETLPILLPVYDIRTIGAGGGSIAWIDSGGLLKVGPQSAGADPGPVCYGKGGTEPTVTDSAVNLGYIDPDFFLGGDIRLNPEAAERSIRAKIATPLGMEVPEASQGIISIVGANMAGACREIMMEKGYDPRDFAVLAFGGAGPVFGTTIAEELGIPIVVIPPAPGNFSAFGMLMIDVTHDFSQTYVELLERITVEEIEEIFESLREKGARILSEEGIPENRRKYLRSIDMRYKGQEHTVNVQFPDQIPRVNKQALEKDFERLHERRYGHRMPDPPQIVHLRVKAIGLMDKPELREIEQGKKGAPGRALKGKRQVFRDGDFTTYRIFNRENLLAGNRLSGPAIIEERTSTTVVHPSQSMEVDRYGNLIIEIGG